MIRDDRYGCRSLVCDANGIIIAEMVHRCMICAHISESINDARQHYQTNHFESSEVDSSSSLQDDNHVQENGVEGEDGVLAHDDDEEDIDDVSDEFDAGHSASASNHDGADQSMGN